MHLLITAATEFELAGIQQRWPAGAYQSALSVNYLVTGVGPVIAAVGTQSYLCSTRKPALLVNVGLAGAFDRTLQLGEVVHVVSDTFGDVGAQTADGGFISAFDLGLVDPNGAPFSGGTLQSTSAYAFAKQVTGVTNSTVHGEAGSIARFGERSEAQVESMEGAAVAYVALRQNIPHIQLRAISNYVEPRDREAWRIELALDNLTEALDAMMLALPGAPAARAARLQLGR